MLDPAIATILAQTQQWLTTQYQSVAGKTVTMFLQEHPELRILEAAVDTAVLAGNVDHVTTSCRAYLLAWRTVLRQHIASQERISI